MEQARLCPLPGADSIRVGRGHLTLRPAGVSTHLPATQAEAANQAWARSFLFSGMSALLLAIAALRPEITYLHFVALVPFLYGLLLETGQGARPGNSIRLGFLLGLTYFGVTLADSLLISPVAALFKLAGGATLFAFFGWTVGQTRRRWGFNPLLLASIWVVFELALIRIGLIDDILGAQALISGSAQSTAAVFLYKTAVIFGLLAISFIIVLLNSVFVLAIETIVALAKTPGMALADSDEIGDPILTPGLAAQRLYLAHEGRAPPWNGCSPVGHSGHLELIHL